MESYKLPSPITLMVIVGDICLEPLFETATPRPFLSSLKNSVFMVASLSPEFQPEMKYKAL